MRTVVVLCGPPGAGKTTLARQSGMTVFDRDDADWLSDRQFNAAIAELAAQPGARAVVIRSGATSSARARVARKVGATHSFLVTAPQDELQRRVKARGRNVARELAGVEQWARAFDDDDGVRSFPGWPAVFGEGIGATSRRW